MEGGAILDIAAKGADNFGLIHIGESFCATGSVPLTVTGNSSYACQQMCMDWGVRPATFDVADVTGDEEPDFFLDMQLVRGGSDKTAGGFAQTWHTLYDNMAHIDRNTLGAVGRTVAELIYTARPL